MRDGYTRIYHMILIDLYKKKVEFKYFSIFTMALKLNKKPSKFGFFKL